MLESLKNTLAVGFLAAFIAVPLLPAQAEAQSDRFRVVVPNMQPLDGAANRFGERVANNVRDMLDLDFHVALSSRDLDRAAREFGLRARDLECITARQLAAQINAQVVMCGEYREVDGQTRYEVTFWTVPDGDELPVAPHTIATRDERAAAEYIVQGFQGIVDRLNVVSYCGQAYGSSNWEDALRHCTRARELAPESRQVTIALAQTYRNLDRFPEALQLYEEVIAEDPYDDASLESAGWLAAQLGESEKSFEYYSRYLEMNPGNVNVRIRIAFELGQAGDAYGALQLLEAGFEQEPDNVELHEQYGALAFRAALDRQGTQPQAQDSDATLDPEVARLYREAINSLGVVIEARGAETRASYITTSMRALVQLGELDEAIAMGQRGAEYFPEEAQIHTVMAEAYNRKNDARGAVAAMERALEINPELPDGRFRIGTFLLRAGQVDDAIAAFRRAEEARERPSDQLATQIFGHAFNTHVQNQSNLPEGIRLFEVAKQFNISEELRSQINFFHGFALLTRGRLLYEANPTSLETARQILPMFQEAGRLLRAGEQYGRQYQASAYANNLDAVAQFIDVAEATIRRLSR